MEPSSNAANNSYRENSTGALSRGAEQIVILAKFGARRHLAQLLQFAGSSEDEMLHANVPAGFGGEKRGGQRDVADVASRQFELAGEEAEVDVGRERRTGGNQSFPDALATIRIGKWKFDDVVHAPSESVVHVAAEVGGEDDDAFVLLHFLEEVGDFDVGVAIVRITDF